MSKLEFVQRMVPRGYQIVSEVAIRWLYKNHRDVYDAFTKRVSIPPKKGADDER